MSLSCKLGWDQGTKGPLERGIFLGGGIARHHFVDIILVVQVEQFFLCVCLSACPNNNFRIK